MKKALVLVLVMVSLMALSAVASANPGGSIQPLRAGSKL
jgi:hypothetical protein